MLELPEWFWLLLSWATGVVGGIGFVFLGAAAWFKVSHYLGLPAIAAGCALMWGAVQYDAATGTFKQAVLRGQLEASQARVSKLEREVAAGRTIVAEAQAREQTARDETEAANKRIADYDAVLETMGANGACSLDDGLWRRLRP